MLKTWLFSSEAGRVWNFSSLRFEVLLMSKSLNIFFDVYDACLVFNTIESN